MAQNTAQEKYDQNIKKLSNYYPEACWQSSKDAANHCMANHNNTSNNSNIVSVIYFKYFTNSPLNTII